MTFDRLPAAFLRKSSDRCARRCTKRTSDWQVQLGEAKDNRP